MTTRGNQVLGIVEDEQKFLGFLEERLLRAIEQRIFSPQNVAYLTRKVNEALQRANSKSAPRRRALEAELSKEEQAARHIKDALRHEKATATLLMMLEEAEEKIQRLQADLRTEPKTKATMRISPSVIETYLRDLRAVLGRDTERARNLLQRLLGDVVLRADQYGLIAELRGNLNATVDVDSDGAGRGILHLPTWRLAWRAVA